MTIKKLNDKFSKCIADEGKVLYFGSDEKEYSQIVCKTKELGKVREA